MNTSLHVTLSQHCNLQRLNTKSQTYVTWAVTKQKQQLSLILYCVDLQNLKSPWMHLSRRKGCKMCWMFYSAAESEFLTLCRCNRSWGQTPVLISVFVSPPSVTLGCCKLYRVNVRLSHLTPTPPRPHPCLRPNCRWLQDKLSQRKHVVLRRQEQKQFRRRHHWILQGKSIMTHQQLKLS